MLVLSLPIMSSVCSYLIYFSLAIEAILQSCCRNSSLRVMRSFPCGAAVAAETDIEHSSWNSVADCQARGCRGNARPERHRLFVPFHGNLPNRFVGLGVTVSQPRRRYAFQSAFCSRVFCLRLNVAVKIFSTKMPMVKLLFDKCIGLDVLSTQLGSAELTFMGAP